MSKTFKITAKHLLSSLLFLVVSFVPAVNADIYTGLGISFLQIRADTGSTTPILADLNIGYEMGVHKVELQLKTSMRDDNLNQLTTDVPLVSSLLYRYIANPRDSLKLDLILGYSMVDIRSSYVDVPSFTESFNGVSFGIGLEESPKSIPQLRFKFDFVQLYRGDQLRLNTFNLGARYVF